MKIFKSLAFSFFALFILASSSCKKETVDEADSKTPTVNTLQVHSVSNFHAKSGGEIVADGGKTVSARGVCWSSTNQEPTINDSKTLDGDGAGIFYSKITGIDKKTKYYVRAYATTQNGTGYGSTMTFTTTSNFYFTPTTAQKGKTVTVSFFGGDDVTFTQGSNCPDLNAMAIITQGSSTIITPSSIIYIDNKHFDATYNISPNQPVNMYNVKVGHYPCYRTEYNSFDITN